MTVLQITPSSVPSDAREDIAAVVQDEYTSSVRAWKKYVQVLLAGSCNSGGYGVGDISASEQALYLQNLLVHDRFLYKDLVSPLNQITHQNLP